MELFYLIYEGNLYYLLIIKNLKVCCFFGGNIKKYNKIIVFRLFFFMGLKLFFLGEWNRVVVNFDGLIEILDVI